MLSMRMSFQQAFEPFHDYLSMRCILHILSMIPSSFVGNIEKEIQYFILDDKSMIVM